MDGGAVGDGDGTVLVGCDGLAAGRGDSSCIFSAANNDAAAFIRRDRAGVGIDCAAAGQGHFGAVAGLDGGAVGDGDGAVVVGLKRAAARGCDCRGIVAVADGGAATIWQGYAAVRADGGAALTNNDARTIAGGHGGAVGDIYSTLVGVDGYIVVRCDDRY